MLMPYVLLSFFVDVESVDFVGFGESLFDECFDFVEVGCGSDSVFFFFVVCADGANVVHGGLKSLMAEVAHDVYRVAGLVVELCA